MELDFGFIQQKTGPNVVGFPGMRVCVCAGNKAFFYTFLRNIAPPKLSIFKQMHYCRGGSSDQGNLTDRKTFFVHCVPISTMLQ